MLAIWKKEFKSYFVSPIGYIFVGVITFLSSLAFINGVILAQSADISVVFSNINWIYLFLAALLTMRMFAEEKNKRTDQLLLTAPISITEMVLGKYLAAMSVLGVSVAVSVIYPFIMCVYADPSISEIIGSYVGFILLWGAFVSVGAFISSLTESQVIAAVFTFISLIIIYFIQSFEASISNVVLQKIVGWFSLMSRYGEFQKGILNIESIIYYLSFIFVFLFLTVRIIDKRRYS